MTFNISKVVDKFLKLSALEVPPIFDDELLDPNLFQNLFLNLKGEYKEILDEIVEWRDFATYTSNFKKYLYTVFQNTTNQRLKDILNDFLSQDVFKNEDTFIPLDIRNLLSTKLNSVKDKDSQRILNKIKDLNNYINSKTVTFHTTSNFEESYAVIVYITRFKEQIVSACANAEMYKFRSVDIEKSIELTKRMIDSSKFLCLHENYTSLFSAIEDPSKGFYMYTDNKVLGGFELAWQSFQEDYKKYLNLRTKDRSYY